MTRINRLTVLGFATLLLFAITSPAFAGGGGAETTGETTETSVAPELYGDGEAPAIIIAEEEVEEFEQPWTARFLIPLLVVTAILLLIGVAIAYNSSIRTRYKVTA